MIDSQLASKPRIRFVSHALGYWPDLPAEKWNDWKWQLKNRVSSLAKLEQLIAVTSSERAGALLAGRKLSLFSDLLLRLRLGSCRHSRRTSWQAIAGYSDGTELPGMDSNRDAVTTSNNSTATVAAYTIPEDTAVLVTATVTAMQSDGSDMAWFQLRASGRRDGSAAPTAHRAAGVVDSELNTTGIAWTAVLDISGNTYRVRVTGDTGKTIKWGVVWQIQPMGAAV